MPRILFFKTSNNNLYMYSYNKNYILLSNSVFIKLFIKTYKKEINNESKLYREIIDLVDDMKYTYSEMKNFINKFRLLQETNFFNEPKFSKIFKGKLKEYDIEYSLANSKTITFEITEKCNLLCKYCFYGEHYSQYNPRKNLNLSLEDAKAVITYLTPKWNSRINVSKEKDIYIGFYGGEPLMNFPFIKEIVEYTKSLALSNGLNFRYNMTTNATLLLKHIQYLVDNDFLLTISLDGNEQFNIYRVYANGKASYTTVYKNVQFIRKKYPAYFKNNVKFNAVLHDKNDFIQVKSFILDEFDATVNCSILNPLQSGDKFRYKSHIYNLGVERDVKCFLSSNEIFNYNSFLRNFSNFHFEDYNDVLFRSKERKYLPTGTCNPFSRRIFITAQGEILPCETIGHRFSLGKVNRGHVNINIEKVISQYNDYFSKIGKYCQSCYAINSCEKCIYLNLIKEDGVIHCKKVTSRELSAHLANHYSVFEELPIVYKKVA